MMKRFFLLVTALTAVIIAQAQPSTGTFSVIPRLGINFANMTNNEVMVDLMDESNTLKSRIKPGVVAGVDVEYQAANDLAVSLGLHYSQQGSRYPDFERKDGTLVEGYSDWHNNLDYLNVPLLFGFHIAKGFSAKAGIQLGILLSAKEHVSYTEIIPHDDGTRQQGNAVPHKTDIKENFKSTDLSIPFGVSYEYENVIIDARYNFGLSRIYNADVIKSRNSVIQLSVGYRFQL